MTPDSGTTATETRFDSGLAWYSGARGWRGDQRHAFRLGYGFSFLWLDFGGDDRDTFGLGWYGRASVLLRVWRKWELELRGDIHAWAGIDEHDFRGIGAGSLSLGLAHYIRYE